MGWLWRLWLKGKVWFGGIKVKADVKWRSKANLAVAKEMSTLWLEAYHWRIAHPMLLPELHLDIDHQRRLGHPPAHRFALGKAFL